MNTTNTAHTSDNKPRDNEMSPFAKAMSDVFSLNAKVEGVSIKLLSAMYEMEATFDTAFCERYTKTSGKDRSAMLDKTLTDLVPSYEDLLSTSKLSLGDYANPADRNRMADRKSDAQKKLKTAQNTLRNVFSALLFLRVGPAHTEKDGKLSFKTPITKIDVKNNKVRFATSEGWYQSTYSSIGELTKFGSNVAREIGWDAPKKAGTPKASEAATSAAKTAEKAKATGGHYQGAMRELSTAICGLLANTPYDKLPEGDLEALRNLEAVLIRKVYADRDGFYDIEALTETYSDKNDKRRKNIELANKSKAGSNDKKAA